MEPRKAILLGILLGFGAGYAYRLYTAPICQLPVGGAGDTHRIASGARSLLNARDAITRMEPVLRPIADGNIPSPQALVRIPSLLS